MSLSARLPIIANAYALGRYCAIEAARVGYHVCGARRRGAVFRRHGHSSNSISLCYGYHFHSCTRKSCRHGDEPRAIWPLLPMAQISHRRQRCCARRLCDVEISVTIRLGRRQATCASSGPLLRISQPRYRTGSKCSERISRLRGGLRHQIRASDRAPGYRFRRAGLRRPPSSSLSP